MDDTAVVQAIMQCFIDIQVTMHSIKQKVDDVESAVETVLVEVQRLREGKLMWVEE